MMRLSFALSLLPLLLLLHSPLAVDGLAVVPQRGSTTTMTMTRLSAVNGWGGGGYPPDDRFAPPPPPPPQRGLLGPDTLDKKPGQQMRSRNDPWRRYPPSLDDEEDRWDRFRDGPRNGETYPTGSGRFREDEASSSYRGYWDPRDNMMMERDEYRGPWGPDAAEDGRFMEAERAGMPPPPPQDPSFRENPETRPFRDDRYPGAAGRAYDMRAERGRRYYGESFDQQAYIASRESKLSDNVLRPKKPEDIFSGSRRSYDGGGERGPYTTAERRERERYAAGRRQQEPYPVAESRDRRGSVADSVPVRPMQSSLDDRDARREDRMRREDRWYPNGERGERRREPFGMEQRDGFVEPGPNGERRAPFDMARDRFVDPGPNGERRAPFDLDDRDGFVGPNGARGEPFDMDRRRLEEPPFDATMPPPPPEMEPYRGSWDSRFRYEYNDRPNVPYVQDFWRDPFDRNGMLYPGPDGPGQDEMAPWSWDSRFRWNDRPNNNIPYMQDYRRREPPFGRTDGLPVPPEYRGRYPDDEMMRGGGDPWYRGMGRRQSYARGVPIEPDDSFGGRTSGQKMQSYRSSSASSSTIRGSPLVRYSDLQKSNGSYQPSPSRFRRREEPIQAKYKVEEIPSERETMKDTVEAEKKLMETKKKNEEIQMRATLLESRMKAKKDGLSDEQIDLFFPLDFLDGEEDEDERQNYVSSSRRDRYY